MLARTGPVAWFATVLILTVVPALWHEPAGRVAAADSPAPLNQGKTSVSAKEQPFGKNAAGEAETLYTLTNSHGSQVDLTTYGARIVAVRVPDRNGKLANVTLGFDSLAPYLEHKMFFGCTTGRFANRIAKGQFELDGKKYQLATNNGPNHLHGGMVGFDRHHWQAKPVEKADAVGVEFSYRSPDGEETFPGTLDTKVVYLWSFDKATNQDVLSLDYSATTDKPTIVNLTNHAYWNLGGVGSGSILGNEVTVEADQYLPIDTTGIPTGKPAPVKGTAFDFTSPHVVGERIEKVKQPPSTTKGYDHCYVLRGQDGKLTKAATVVDPKSGRTMEIFTTEPGIQLYCGNFLEGDTASGGFNQHDALCLETQHYPDSPNQPDFPTTTLKPGQTYRQTTEHRFGVK